MKSKDKPYILYVAEKIYLEVSEIKKKNNGFSNIDAIDGFIGSETYQEVSSGKFHDNWFEELEKNNEKIPEETMRLLKIIYHLRYPKEHLIIFGECVKVMSYGAKRLNKMNLFN